MDKYEYKVRSEEILKLIDQEKYTEAVKIADTIDWRRVKSATMLLRIAILYRISKRGDDSREILMLAYDRYPGNRSVVYSLCELSIELDDVVSAVEYYKQFVKLAPKDSGVFTLRYRILEAQEASIEERIEILEELKRRDYQEEWAYELAYLYHKAGFSTKCVEECDDIILWFGDGPYVVKAMELKAMHVPLTDTQQKNYEIMLGNAENNYSSIEQEAEDFTDQNYSAEDYGGQNYDAENYDEEGYADQNFDTEYYGTENYDTGNYGENSYGNVDNSGEYYQEDDYAQEGYADETYADADYVQETYTDEMYTNDGYVQENYEGEAYPDDGNEQEMYVDNSYGQETYTDETYADNSYGQGAYTDETYADDGYGQNNYVDDGYGNLSYTDGSYEDNSYTGEFYVEQVYDENQNQISFETYPDQDYPQTQDFQGDEQENTPKQYRNGLHLVENTNAQAPAGNSGDMSQYNTINLQKVVAESMKELFPDDDDDVFAEDREKYNSNEPVKGDTRSDTRVFAGVVRPDHTALADESVELAEEPSDFHMYTGRVAQMVTGVIETAPEPNTGAVRKVFVPGDNARSIKSDSDIEQLRDITEKSVDDEHSRMENNDENVYHEQSITDIDEAAEALKSQATSSMKLDNVLIEWERMKQENAKKHQEEIKKRVLTQTGRIFENFDISIKSGILGELEREEEQSRKRSSMHVSRDRFLDADVTGDIPQPPASEEDFEVEYITDSKEDDHNDDHNKKAAEAEKIEKAEKPQKTENPEESEEDAKDAYLAMLERVTSKINLGEIGGSEEEKPADHNVEDTADEKNKEHMQDIDAQGEPEPESKIDQYTQELYTEEEPEIEIIEINEYEQETYAKEEPEREIDQYTQELYTEEEPEDETIEINEYEQEVYTEEEPESEIDPYEQEVYADYMTSEYTQEIPVESAVDYAADEYAQETYTEEPADYASDYTQEISVEGIENYGEYTQEIVDGNYAEETAYSQESSGVYEGGYHAEDVRYNQGAFTRANNNIDTPRRRKGHDESNVLRRHQQYQYNEKDLDPEDAQSIAEMAQEDALKTQEIKMNTADLSSLSEKIVATTNKEARGAAREELREFTPEEQELFENFAVTKKIKKQIIHALDNMTLAAYTGNVIITGDAGLDIVKMAKNLVKEYQTLDESFSGKLAKITGEKINQRNIKDVFEKLNNGGIIIEKANGMSEEKLYEMAHNLNQENLGIVVIMEDTKKEITKLLEKQAMIADYFNIRIDLMEMDNNALVAYAKNYALALEYSIDELGTLALYTRIANMQSGNHVVTKDEVRDIIDEAIWKSKKSKIKNFVDVLFARRYDNEDMIVLKERDFM